MSTKTIDELLDKKRQQIEAEKSTFEPDLLEKLEENDGLLLEKIIVSGYAEILFEESDFTKSRVRRLTPFLPSMVSEMNKDSKGVVLSLIKGRYAEDAAFVGVRITAKEQNEKE